MYRFSVERSLMRPSHRNSGTGARANKIVDCCSYFPGNVGVAASMDLKG